MPKTAKAVGRKDCMEAMCHQCRNYNADTLEDCGIVACPLYPFNPLATQEPDTRWKHLRTGKTIGFAPKKRVPPEEYKDAVEMVATWKYGWNPSAAPAVIRKQCDDLGVVIAAPAVQLTAEPDPVKEAFVADGIIDDSEDRGW